MIHLFAGYPGSPLGTAFGEIEMHDLVIVLAFIGVVVTPAVFAARSDTKPAAKRAPSKQSVAVLQSSLEPELEQASLPHATFGGQN
jgi:hypothetical protein